MVKIVAVALVCAIIIVYLKSINSEFITLAIISSGIIIIGFGLTYLKDLFLFMDKLIALSGLSAGIYKIILKIVAIGYLVEFGAGTIEDFGLKSLADKLVFVGKMLIFSVSLPIIYSLINLLTELVQ